MKINNIKKNWNEIETSIIETTGKLSPELDIFAPYDNARIIRVHGEMDSIRDNLCVFRSIAEALIIKNKLNDVPKRNRDRYITKMAKDLFKTYYGKKYYKNYKKINH